MNPRIRWVGFVLLASFGLLFVQLNNIQVRQANKLSQNPVAHTDQTNVIYMARGAILSANRKILAYSKKIHGQWARVYPGGTAIPFGQITGFVDTTSVSISYGIEAEYNRYLSEHESAANTLNQLLTQHQETDDILLTIPTSLQEDAVHIIAGQREAEIVALDPRTGAVLAMDGTPNYNPNLLATLNRKVATHDFGVLAKQYPEPFNSPATAYPYGPGSTFKVIDTAAIYDHDPSLAYKVWPSVTQITIPQTPTPFHNYGYSNCGGPLPEILAVSCDTAYAEVGLALGSHTVVREATGFGWCQEGPKRLPGQCAGGGRRPPIDLPPYQVAGATMAPETLLDANPPYLAYSSIGQYDDAASALSMALVAAGIADNGKIMAPHLMSEIIDSDGNVVVRYHPHLWKRATSTATATEVRKLMLGPTATTPYVGTAAGVFSNLQSAGIDVAAKTGTAEAVEESNGVNCATHDWLIAMAPANPGVVPKAVVAAEVYTPNGTTNCSDATGARIAGPLVDQMLTDVLRAGR